MRPVRCVLFLSLPQWRKHWNELKNEPPKGKGQAGKQVKVNRERQGSGEQKKSASLLERKTHSVSIIHLPEPRESGRNDNGLGRKSECATKSGRN